MRGGRGAGGASGHAASPRQDLQPPQPPASRALRRAARPLPAPRPAHLVRNISGRDRRPARRCAQPPLAPRACCSAVAWMLASAAPPLGASPAQDRGRVRGASLAQAHRRGSTVAHTANQSIPPSLPPRTARPEWHARASTAAGPEVPEAASTAAAIRLCIYLGAPSTRARRPRPAPQVGPRGAHGPSTGHASRSLRATCACAARLGAPAAAGRAACPSSRAGRVGGLVRARHAAGAMGDGGGCDGACVLPKGAPAALRAAPRFAGPPPSRAGSPNLAASSAATRARCAPAGAPSTAEPGTVRSYDEEIAYLERVDDQRWRIKVRGGAAGELAGGQPPARAVRCAARPTAREARLSAQRGTRETPCQGAWTRAPPQGSGS